MKPRSSTLMAALLAIVGIAAGDKLPLAEPKPVRSWGNPKRTLFVLRCMKCSQDQHRVTLHDAKGSPETAELLILQAANAHARVCPTELEIVFAVDLDAQHAEPFGRIEYEPRPPAPELLS